MHLSDADFEKRKNAEYLYAFGGARSNQPDNERVIRVEHRVDSNGVVCKSCVFFLGYTCGLDAKLKRDAYGVIRPTESCPLDSEAADEPF